MGLSVSWFSNVVLRVCLSYSDMCVVTCVGIAMQSLIWHLYVSTVMQFSKGASGPVHCAVL